MILNTENSIYCSYALIVRTKSEYYSERNKNQNSYFYTMFFGYLLIGTNHQIRFYSSTDFIGIRRFRLTFSFQNFYKSKHCNYHILNAYFE